MIRGVIFDMDGLMFDTERLSTEFWRQAGKTFGTEISAEAVDSFRGRNGQAIRSIFEELYGEVLNYDQVVQVKRQLAAEHYQTIGVPVKKGLLELLEYLKEHRIRMAVATSTNHRTAELMLQTAGVYGYFQKIVYGDTVERSKPYPDIFQKAAEELGLSAKDCLVLEDSTVGIEAAKASGSHVIHIPDLIRVPEEVKRGIDAELENLHDVIGWLEEDL